MNSRLRCLAPGHLLTFFLVVAALLGCRPASLPPRNYREVLVVNHTIWLLTAAGKIEVYDAQGTPQPLPSVAAVTAQHLATDGDNVLAQIGSRLARWNVAKSRWETVGKMPATAFGIAANRQHRVFAVTTEGVLEVGTGKTYLPTSWPNHQLRQLTAFGQPAACFMDSEDRLWLGFGYGEWGGNIFAFDTNKHKFSDLQFNKFNIELSPVKSFFQLPNGVGVSAGLQHFTNSGTLAEFTPAGARLLYDTWADRDTARTRQPHFTEQPYIGPATYDAAANQLYFYSQLGVYQAPYGQDLTKLTSWHKVFEPRLHWRSGQPDAIGSPMNVLAMLALGEGKLVLLTQNDGAGIWNGHSFELLTP
ncbi:hypothetical protein GKZ68_07770 [Hymenobacter sp. BRD128]|uniref:hypothetical protein n=1 Tax=Hymenobacter sp. BRD128 TaxID=2675878 RepID=UPI001567A19A|nr:hypothetical protein [Hymenobacter sp. BRD128]QKG56536.1 hypothetical protein GKZ68_07770 [Hymenobacter sp. BRD128]